jgi:hypothetical protein
MILRLIITAILIVLIPGLSIAQPTATIIKTQAIDMGRALVNNDLPGFQKYLHPDILKHAGGTEKMKAMYDSAQTVFKKVGGSIKRITYGNPADIVSYKKEIQTTVPQTMYITTSFADIEMESILVAISQDKGKHWYFIDSQLYSTSSTQQKLPSLSPELVIPPPSKPRMIPKEK